MLLRTGNRQQLAKIATYPTDVENQGHLEIIPGTAQYDHGEEAQPQSKTQNRRGLAVLLTLFSP